MTFGNLKTYVSTFMKRSSTAFVKDGFDALDQALKNARIRVQREHDWEFNKTTIEVTVNAGSFWAITPVVDVYGSADVNAKKFQRAYSVNTDGTTVTPLKIVTREWLAEHVDRREDINAGESYLNRPYVVRHGNKFYIEPAASSSQNIRFDIVRWAADLGAGESDFLTDYCHDLILYYAIMELNLYIKDDERVGISTGFYKAALKSAKMWDLDQNENMTNEYIID